jgi:hypothetical protein
MMNRQGAKKRKSILTAETQREAIQETLEQERFTIHGK